MVEWIRALIEQDLRLGFYVWNAHKSRREQVAPANVSMTVIYVLWHKYYTHTIIINKIIVEIRNN